MNEFACFAYRSALIRPAEREIKPAQNVVTNPFKCGGGSLRCEPARVSASGHGMSQKATFGERVRKATAHEEC